MLSLLKRSTGKSIPLKEIIKDGYLYGRGALDDKSMGIMEMMALLILKREKVPLKEISSFLQQLMRRQEENGESSGSWRMFLL